MKTRIVAVSVGSKNVYINPVAIESIAPNGAKRVRITMVSGQTISADVEGGLKEFCEYLREAEHSFTIADGD